jgi:hypothetical protein
LLLASTRLGSVMQNSAAGHRLGSGAWAGPEAALLEACPAGALGSGVDRVQALAVAVHLVVGGRRLSGHKPRRQAGLRDDHRRTGESLP